MENSNRLIAEFMGFTQEKNIGWYDNDMLMSQNVYDSQDGNCFNELLFHTSWDWLMPVANEIIKSRDEQNSDWDLTDLKYALQTTNIELVHQSVVEFIKLKQEGK